jgi:alanyl-tRNA synthetase
MTSGEIRQGFLNFFASRGHTIVPSSPVIPHGDPTLLFTNAGMNQFKDVFLGTGKRDYTRAADTQKCIRVSGKHNDLEEVGRDTYHHTFFEMLGNWSFGDYYKKEAISWAWELLTGVWGLEKARLYATVFETDDEAAELWATMTDINPAHILRFGKKDNFWEMGETGPCGPCSEIHIDLTPDCSGGNLVNAGDPRVMEIWNLVFIQNNRNDLGGLEPLPAKHVDTGMGFERLCAVLQGKRSNYDTDIFTPIIASIVHATGQPYEGESNRVAMRVIADHIRMLTFSIADGATPANDGRGYVLRRILRRAARFGRNLGMHEPFLYRITASVVTSMGDAFPEIAEKQKHVERIIRAEEESFNQTLDRGLEIFSSVIERIGHSTVFPGEDAFRLYDTFGFPIDLTQLMAEERGLKVDLGTFSELMEEQRARARDSMRNESTKTASEVFTILDRFNDSKFVGYDEIETETRVEQIIDGKYLSLERTPFYVESGGQVDDLGSIEAEDFLAEVLDSVRRDTKIVHEIRILRGDPRSVIGKRVRARVDAGRRRNIQRNHSATHLVHEALRQVLGTHLHQQGSLVAPDRLRFDFNHFAHISPEELRAIEAMVNQKIADGIAVNALNDPRQWITIDDAKRRYPNVKMFFGDKYGEKVRIVEIDPKFSVELCGGTHVPNTADIGLFKIIAESGIASGIRRIEAVTGEGVKQYVDGQLKKISQLDDHLARLVEEMSALERSLGRAGAKQRPLPAPPAPEDQPRRETLDRIDNLLKGRTDAIEDAARVTQDLRKEASRQRIQQGTLSLDALIAAATTVKDVALVAARVEARSMDELKNLGDALRAKLHSGVGILGTVIEGKVALVCVVTDDLIRDRGLQAGTIVGRLAQQVGGGGGGKPHLATAGGKDAQKLDSALADAPRLLDTLIRNSLMPGI